MKICFHVKFMVKRSQLSVFNALQMKRRLEWIVRKHALTAVSSSQDYCKQAFIVVRSSDIVSAPNFEIQSLFGIPLRPPLFYVPGHANKGSRSIIRRQDTKQYTNHLRLNLIWLPNTNILQISWNPVNRKFDKFRQSSYEEIKRLNAHFKRDF